MTATPGRSRQQAVVWTWAACILVAGAAFVAFSPALRAGFINFDDTLYVTENSRVQQGLTVENAVWSLTARRYGNWHPVTWMSHMMDVSLFGLNPSGHHLTSLLIHCAAAVMLLLFLHRATGDLAKSAVVAAFFALHPLRAESVVWVAERKDVLSVFFGFASLLAYVVYVKRRALWRYGLMTCLLALSLMSKPMLVTAPFLLLLLDYWPLRRLDEGAGIKKLVVEKLPLVALIAVISGVAFVAQYSGGAVGTFEKFPVPSRVWNAAISYWMYVWKTVWPVNLALFYPHRGTETSVAAGIGAAVLLLVATFAAVAQRRRAPYVTMGWFWYLGLLVPVIGLIQIGEQAYADRYTYLPSVGLYIGAVWGVSAAFSRGPAARKALAGATAGVLALLAVASFAQTLQWRSSETVWRKTIAATVKNTTAHTKLANALQQQGRADEAWKMLEQALDFDPNNSMVYNNLGSFKLSEGKPAEALNYLQEALRLRPENTPARVNFGIALCSANRVEEGLRELREARQADPGNIQANYNLGVAALGRQEYGEAASCFAVVLDTAPTDVSARVGYGISLVHMGSTEEAVPHLQEALRLDPQNADALAYLRQLGAQK